MNFRLKTNEATAEVLKSLHSSTNLTPNILARISIALSLNIEDSPDLVEGENNGLEFNRNTLTGDQDYFYKLLIKQHAQRDVPEEEYFPGLFNAHLSRGIHFLNQEYQHSGNSEKFLNNLIKMIE